MTESPLPPNPFPGLRPFRQDEDHLFFGREEQTMELLQTLGQHRFVAVVGTSGSGKSSLVRCGLLSQLLGGKMLQAGTVWEVAVTHPGGDPMSHLADALLHADIYDADEEDAKTRLLATLQRSHFGLVEAIRQAQLEKGTNVLLVVDQFEEIFRFNQGGSVQREPANEFVSMLLQATVQAEVPIYIVLTMRSDFIGDCAQFEDLAEAVNRGEYLIPRMTREQFKQCVEGPIRVAGGSLTPRLLQRLLNDLGQQADQLPCLQHALMRTWDRVASVRPGGTLDLEDYEAIGRMQEALSRHADEIYDSLANERERELCEALFRAITVRESENRGIRRPQRLARLAAIIAVDQDELKPIIEAYRRHGVTFLMPSPEVALDDGTVIDISHESLMRVWVRLRGWVEKEAESVGIFHRLAESAALHTAGRAGLYRDPELGIALSWRDSEKPNPAWSAQTGADLEQALAYLTASQEAEEQEEKAREEARQRELAQAKDLADAQCRRAEEQRRSAGRMRMLGAVASVIALIALVASGYALNARRQARDNEVRALSSAEEAEEQREFALAAKQTLREELYTADMVRVLRAYEQGDNERVIELLESQVPAPGENDLRGIEWRMWWGAANRHLAAVNPQYHAGWSPGSYVDQFLPVCVYPGTIVVFRASDWKVETEFRLYDDFLDQPGWLHEAFANPLITPDGQWLIAPCDDGVIRRWRVADWEEVLPRLPIETEELGMAAFQRVRWAELSEDGSHLVLEARNLGKGRRFWIYDVTNWTFRAAIEFKGGAKRSSKFLSISDRQRVTCCG